MREIKHIDYIGFTFNERHSSELGIVRTSDGSRFNENLLPISEDKTVSVPGGDGTYYFGSYFTKREFEVMYAFDNLTEEDLEDLKKWLGDKKIHDLVFDEAPYKKYRAKVVGSSAIKYIPFAEGETNRVYKGEGTIYFSAFEPYAKSTYKYQDQYDSNNIEEWSSAANLLPAQDNFDTLINNSIKLYNPGVKDSDFILTMKLLEGKVPAGSLSLSTGEQLVFEEISALGEDTHIKFNTKINLIEGYKENNGKLIKTGNIYNKHHTNGTFFKVPCSTDTENPIALTINNIDNLENHFVSIEYDYYYF